MKNSAYFMIAILLIAFGVFLSSEKIAIALVGASASNYHDVVQGALLFRLSLILNGFALLIIGIMYSQFKRSTLANETAPMGMNNGYSEKQQLQYWLPLAIILIIAAALRLYKLNSCLWYDEVATLVEFVRLPLQKLITVYSDQNNHPLFSFLGHLSVELFGESAWALRLPAFLFGLASIIALYLFGRCVTDKREAILATLLMAVSYHHVWFSQNARGYTGMLFWGLFGTWIFINGLNKNRLSIWMAYAVSMALGMYTHLTTVFILASHVMIYSFILLRRQKFAKNDSNNILLPLVSFLLVGLFTLQLYALIIPQVVESFHVQVGGGRVEAWTNPVWAMMELIRGLRLGFGTVFAGAIAGLIFLCGLVNYARNKFIVAALFLIPVVMGAAVLLILHRHFYPRFFFFDMGIGILILIRGTTVITSFILQLIVHVKSRDHLVQLFSTGIAGMIIVASIFSLQHNYRYPKQDFLGALNFIKKYSNTDALIVTVGLATYPYKYYYTTQWEFVETTDELKNLQSQNKAIWLIYTSQDHLKAFYPEISSAIRKEFTVVGKFPGTLGGGTVFVCRAEPPFSQKS